MELSKKGYRLIAVSKTEKDKKGHAIGLIAFYDPPRQDASDIVKRLQDLGLRILMLTGDSEETAKTIAEEVGIGQKVCPVDLIRKEPQKALLCDVFANVFPEDKFNLVKELQKGGQIVGMTGDGVNDAPALKQAEVGIAVSNAMDVVKSAASIVLMHPGLWGLIKAIQESRQIYQRMFIYALNKVIKSLEIIVFLSLGFILERNLILTPLLMVILFFANDFASMAIATNVAPSTPKPVHWDVKKNMAIGTILALFMLLFSFGVFYFGKYALHFSLMELQTLVFLTLVFTGQGTIYIIRERQHFWHSRPSYWLISVSIIDLGIIIFMALKGLLLTPLAPTVIFGLLFLTIVYIALLDFIKVPIFARLLQAREML